MLDFSRFFTSDYSLWLEDDFLPDFLRGDLFEGTVNFDFLVTGDAGVSLSICDRLFI